MTTAKPSDPQASPLPQQGTPQPPKYKIFPRNLTARADYIVAGNPTNSRPEAGVDNCYPGLEFDQRNLDQRFFPGLTFYYHRGDGARLIALQLTQNQKASGLLAADILDPPVYLWGMVGRHLVQESGPSTVSFQGQNGMEVWRRVHDLLPGPVAIVFGPTPGLAADLTQSLRGALVDEQIGLRGLGRSTRLVSHPGRCHRPSCLPTGDLGDMPHPPVIAFPGIEAVGRLARSALALGPIHRRQDGNRDTFGDLVLHHENIG